jgi:hypothetical protein
MNAVIIVLVLTVIIELLAIVGMASDRQALRDELGQVRSQLRKLRSDDARFVDQLMERGRHEVERLEAYYRRNLSSHQQPIGLGINATDNEERWS